MSVCECLCGSGFSRLCVNGWAVSACVLRREPREPHPEPFNRDVVGFFLDVLVRVRSSRHSRRSLWRGCGCTRSSLAAVPARSASRSVRRPPVGGLHRPCGREVLLTSLTTRRFSLLTNDGFCTRFAVLLSLRFCRQPERGAVLQRQQRVPHGLLQCNEPSLHRAYPRLLQEGTARSAVPSDRARGMCDAAGRTDALLR